MCAKSAARSYILAAHLYILTLCIIGIIIYKGDVLVSVRIVRFFQLAIQIWPRTSHRLLRWLTQPQSPGRAVCRISCLFYSLKRLTAVAAHLGVWFVGGQRMYLSARRANDGSKAKVLEGAPARLEWRYEPGSHAVFTNRGAGFSNAISAPNSQPMPCFHQAGLSA